MRLVLVRHGTTDGQRAGRYQGASDPPLSRTGREQASALGARLPPGPFRCLCSPRLRARETAEMALAGAGRELEFVIVEALREIDFGRWEGLTFAEILAQDQALVAAWQRHPARFRFPDGEATSSFWRRVRGVLGEIISRPEPALVICHGGVIRAMLCLLLALPRAKALCFDIQPASLTVLEVDGVRGQLLSLNR
ncbi:MAG: histidine phosphatase family protein [Desulfobacteraceae bacterium]|nr:histidine phosphatase family protein [Desulfobacteraceae bacterium]